MELDGGTETEWEVIPTPFGADLEAVAHAADGPYAAGEEGILAASRPDGWEAVIERDALAADGDLLAVDTTRAGERVWFAGDNGILGMFDTESGAAVGYDYTGEAAATWSELAVTGDAGEERALLANDASAVISFDLDGEELAFSEPTRPSDTEIVALETADDGVGYAVDAHGAVHTATATGWESLGSIGAEGEPTDLAATTERLVVTATDGRLYEHEGDTDWSATEVADEELLAVDVDDRETVVLAPDATFYSRSGGETWERTAAETGDRLVALALGPADVAVGENGAVVQRCRTSDDGEAGADTELPPVEEDETTADEPADESPEDSPTESDEQPDDVAAIEDAENAVEDVDAAVDDAENAVESADAEAAVEAVEGATEDVEAAVADAANAAAEEPMDEHTQLIVEELLSRAETEDLIELLRASESGELDFVDRVAELVGEHAHDCAGDGCSCGPECDCGDDCRCDETGNCECDRCTCGHEECSCGTVSDGCSCGGNCTCGENCDCGVEDDDHAHDCADDGCSCGSACDCGDDCACDSAGTCQCDTCSCDPGECSCGDTRGHDHDGASTQEIHHHHY